MNDNLVLSSVVCVAVIEVADLHTDVTLASFIGTMEYRLAAIYSHAMSQTGSSRRRHKRARIQHNATVQVQPSSMSAVIDPQASK